MKKALVTGGTGFVGSSISLRLIEMGFEVTALDINKGNSKEIEEKGGKIILGSVSDKALVEKLVKGKDYVFHIAAAFRKINIPDKEYYDSNVSGTKTLLDAAVKNKIKRFIYCSTCGVHGAIKNIPADEHSPFSPENYYHDTKVEAENMVLKYSKELPVAVIRPIGIYGPRDTRFLPVFKQIKHGKFVMIGNGRNYYHLGYIDNLVDAFILAMTKKEALGRAFLIGHDGYMTVNEMIGMIADAVGTKKPKIKVPFGIVWIAAVLCEFICKIIKVEPPLFRRRLDFFSMSRAFSIERAKRELGFVPKISVEEGLKRTAQWYEKEGWL